MFSDFHANLGDGESLAFVALATLSFGGLGTGPFGLFLVAAELSLEFDVHGHGLAVAAGSDLAVDLDLEVVLEEGVAADGDDVTAGALGGVHGSQKFNADIGLRLGVGGFDDLVADGAETVVAGEGFSGLVGSGTDGNANEQLAEGVLGDVEEVLDGVGGSLLEGLLAFTLQFFQGEEGSLLTQKSDDESVSSCYEKTVNKLKIDFQKRHYFNGHLLFCPLYS